MTPEQVERRLVLGTVNALLRRPFLHRPAVFATIPSGVAAIVSPTGHAALLAAVLAAPDRCEA